MARVRAHAPRWFASLAALLVCAGLGAIGGMWWAERAAERPLFRAEPARVMPEPAAVMPSFRGVVADAMPAVATVRGHRRVPSDAGDATALRTGSGFVVHAAGLLLTSRHVIEGAHTIDVVLPVHGLRAASLVGEDRASDLALLRLVEPVDALPVLALASDDDLHAGDWIVTVGNPLGLAQSVTAGVIGYVGRHLPHSDFALTNDFLQLSAPANPGSSGCPVFDVQGRVVGMTTQVATAAPNIAFAVPARTMRWSMLAMQRTADGRVRRGHLGIEFGRRPPDRDGAERPGAVIVRVAAGRPAERAGLRVGDVVLRVDDTPVRDPRDLHDRIVCADPGTAIRLQLLREGRVHDRIEAVLGEVGQPDGRATPN
jgi:serine protease Do